VVYTLEGIEGRDNRRERKGEMINNNRRDRRER
jgi:hypothetical protein